MDKRNAKDLLNAYLAGTCTEEEKAMLESWYEKLDGKGLPVKTQSEKDRQLQEVWLGLPVHQSFTRFLGVWKFTAAALVFLGLGIALYFCYTLKVRVTTEQNLAGRILPGTNKAILTLSNGSRIALLNTTKGEIAKDHGIIISKTTDGQLVYQSGSNEVANGSVAYNSLETPRGGQYALLLPDGSKVWLNASSKLKFPANFVNQNQRKVELEGEAYFEVAKNRDKPFIVKTASQEVRVLGTHFNINSYTDEPVTKTTLIEGSVIVNVLNDQSIASSSIKLIPGQESCIQKGQLTVNAVNAKEAVSWKTGVFVFKDADIQMVMRSIERWYNIDVVYQGKVPERLFSGEIHRNVNLQQFLEILGFYHVNFHLEGRKLIVQP